MSWHIVYFFAAGVVGGAVNAAAGGAKLFVFPMLLASGLPPLAANATGTVALWPATMPALWVYRDRLREDRRGLALSLIPALIGALVGASTLIFIGERLFVASVPFFLAVAVVTIVFGEQIAARARRAAERRARGAGVATKALLFACGFYGGFFGAGMGFMLIAVLTLAGMADIHGANARKNLFAVMINTTAVIPLAMSGLIDWRAAPAVLLGGLAGGYLGAHVVRRLPQRPMRIGVAALGVVLTLSFLLR